MSDTRVTNVPDFERAQALLDEWVPRQSWANVHLGCGVAVLVVSLLAALPAGSAFAGHYLWAGGAAYFAFTFGHFWATKQYVREAIKQSRRLRGLG